METFLLYVETLIGAFRCLPIPPIGSAPMRESKSRH